MNGYDYDWDGMGLTITTPAGECYLQGEEGSQLYDELEALETNEQVVDILSGYEHVCE